MNPQQGRLTRSRDPPGSARGGQRTLPATAAERVRKATIGGARTGSGSGSILAAATSSSLVPSPSDCFGLPHLDFGRSPHPGSLRRLGLRACGLPRGSLSHRFAPLAPRFARPSRSCTPLLRGRLCRSFVCGSGKVVLGGAWRRESSDVGAPPTNSPSPPGPRECRKSVLWNRTKDCYSPPL